MPPDIACGAEPPEPGALQPTPGWAPEFCRVRPTPERERAALRVDWGDNLLEETAVTFGLPFARRALPDSGHARLVDDRGRTAPAQFETTATWDGPDGSVRWALVHANLRRDREYYVEYGSQVHAPEARELQIVETGSDITVTTGPMRFVISKTTPTLIHAAALRREGGGGFDPDDLIMDPRHTAGALPSVIDGEGTVYEASAEEFKVEIVAQGGMQAAIRREGWYVDSGGTKFCRFITYTYFHAGAAGFRHDHTLVVAFDTHRHQIRDIALPLPLNLQGDRRAWFASDGSPDGALIEYPAGQDPLSLIEDYRHGWTLWRGEEALAEGRRSGGWFGLADARRGAFAGISQCWQNSPAELEVTSRGLELHLYASRRTEPLDFRPSAILGGRGEEYPGNRVFYRNLYRDGLDEMTQGFGIGKTHTLHFQFFSEAERAAAARRTRLVNMPVIPWVAPEWACRTEAFGRVWPYDPERFPELEQALDAIVERQKRLREQLDIYGWFHFGDFPHRTTVTEDGQITFLHWRRWASMFHGVPNMMPMLFLRSGRRDAWEFHRANARHITDIDICHLDHEAWGKWKGGRYGGNGGIVHFAANLYRLGVDSHLRFMLYDYYLNGNLRTREVAHYYARACAEDSLSDYYRTYRHRSTGGSLRLATEAYQATWDPVYLDMMRRFAGLLYEEKAASGVTRYDDTYMNEAKILYYQATGDERMRDLFLSNMRILHGRRDAHGLRDRRAPTRYGLAHAFWFTGDRAFLPFALWQVDLVRQGLAAYAPPLATQLPSVMAALVDAGEPLPRPEGPRPRTCGALHFLQDRDGPVEIALEIWLNNFSFAPYDPRAAGRSFLNWRSWMERLAEEDRPALALLDPDGREVRRLRLSEMDLSGKGNPQEPAGVAAFRHPADGKAGVYTVQPLSPVIPLESGLYSSNLERWMVDLEDAAITCAPMSPVFFRVPGGTKAFAVHFKSAVSGGTQAVSVLDEEGVLRGVAELRGAGGTWQALELDGGGLERDQSWSFHTSPQLTFFLRFDGIPAYGSGTPEGLFLTDRKGHIPPPDEGPRGSQPSFRPVEELGGVPVAVIPPGEAVAIQGPETARGMEETGQGTVEMWVKCHRSKTQIEDRGLVSLGALRLWHHAALRPWGHSSTGMRVSLGPRDYPTGFVLPAGRWVHVAATWKAHPKGGVDVALFADGLRIDSMYSGRLDADGATPGHAMEIPRGKTGLSLARLRVSSSVRYEDTFTPPEPAALVPDTHTLTLWPINLEGHAWLFGGNPAGPFSGAR